MISYKDQVNKLQAAMELIESVLSDNGSHGNQSVYLSVAAEYCQMVSDAEKRKAEIDDILRREGVSNRDVEKDRPV